MCALCVTVPAQQRGLQLSKGLLQAWQSRLASDGRPFKLTQSWQVFAP